jgi:hypothetical protein
MRFNYSIIFYGYLFKGSFQRLRFCSIKWQDGFEQLTENKAEGSGIRLPISAFTAMKLRKYTRNLNADEDEHKKTLLKFEEEQKKNLHQNKERTREN